MIARKKFTSPRPWQGPAGRRRGLVALVSPHVHCAGCTFAFASRDRLAQHSVAPRRDPTINQLAHLADAGDVIQIGNPADAAPRGDRPHRGFEAGVQSAIWRDQVHLLHASVMCKTGKWFERTGLLEIYALHGAVPGHAEQSP